MEKAQKWDQLRPLKDTYQFVIQRADAQNKVHYTCLERFFLMKPRINIQQHQVQLQHFNALVAQHDTPPADVSQRDAEAIRGIKADLQGRIPDMQVLEQRLNNALNGDDIASIFMPPLTPVIEGLYLGNQRNVGVLPAHEPNLKAERESIHSQLKALNIEVVISCCGEKVQDKDTYPCIKYKHFGIGDTPDNPEFLEQLPKSDACHSKSAL